LFLAAVGLVVACEDDPVSPATTGSIALEFVIPSESGGSAGPATAGPANGAGESSSAPALKKATFDAARATAIGPETVSINLTLIGANWQGTIGDLTPGSYRVIVEGFEGGIVDWYGEASSVSVSAGQTSTATVTFDTFVPDFDPVQTPTTSTTVTVNFQSVGYAASYTVEWDTDPGFGGPQTISGITGTSVNIDVPGPGVYYVRIQAVNSQVSSGGVWSDVVSFEVVGTSFAGFLSLPGGGFGDTLVVKPASNMPWDGDEYVLIGGEEPFYVDQNLDSIAIAIPDVPVASQTLEVGDQGPGDVIQTRSFLVTSRFTQNTDPLTSPDITAGPFPMEFYISLYDGSPDHFYTLAPGADMGVRVSMEFQTNADLDVTWTDQSFSFNVGNFDGAGTSPFEMSTVTVPSGLTWRLWFNKWDVGAGTPKTMALVRIETVALGLITAGQNHSCGLTPTGDVYCWGYNDFGQLGNGTNTFSNTPVLVSGGLSFRSVSAGSRYSCGLDGSTAYCWGVNGNGQLGNGTFTDATTPGAVTAAFAFATVEVGANHACGVDTGGNAYCWGANWDGQVGDGTTGSSVTTPTTVLGGLSFFEVSAGQWHSCGIATSGAAYCWGANFYGQLGDGTTTDATAPVLVSGGLNWYAISAGYYTTCGITDAREVYCWGSGSYLGDSYGADSPVPVIAVSGLNNFEQASAGRGTCGMTSDGDVYCWGEGYWGQGGDGTTNFHSSPVQVASNEFFRTVSVGIYHTCAGADDGDAFCWGRNQHGQLGDLNTPFVDPLPVGLTAQSISTGDGHACSVDGSGTAHCWGVGSSGQLGNGQSTRAESPVAVPSVTNFQEVSAGGYHSCGVTTTQQAYCWGANWNGQVGDGTFLNQDVPTLVSGGFSFGQLGTGWYHSCGVTTGGSVYCWGWNDQGQIGDGTTNDAGTPLPVAVPGTAQRAYGGYRHSCALTSTGAVYCWGDNAYGQLGDGTNTDQPAPTLVSGAYTFVKLDLGESHTCGIDNLGATYCWGAGWDGRIGDGTTNSYNVPTPVSGTFQAISAGEDHTCGLNGTAGYCWGWNRFAVIGNGTKTEQETVPVPAGGGLAFNQISAGGQFTCGITTGGAVYCWGENSEAQLGAGYRSIETLPVQVSGGLVLRAPRDVTATPPRGSKARGMPRQ
jgi:alpha-tubulin suppressor-like RCC1 family protein